MVELHYYQKDSCNWVLELKKLYDSQGVSVAREGNDVVC